MRNGWRWRESGPLVEVVPKVQHGIQGRKWRMNGGCGGTKKGCQTGSHGRWIWRWAGGFMDFQLHNAPVYCSSSCWCPSQGMCTRERVLTWKKSFQKNFYIPNNAVATRIPCALVGDIGQLRAYNTFFVGGAAMAGCGNHELNEFEAFYNIICNANILA